jgi:integrase
MHNDFTLFLRKYPNGREVYFYYTYDEKGQRRGPWTTKSLTKTAARNFCHGLIRKGGLIPDRIKTVTFGAFARGFWERGSEYVARQESRKDISESYISNCRRLANNQIAPFFGDTPLDKITEKDVNDWLLGFKNRKAFDKDGKEVTKNYRNNTANFALWTFTAMMSEAVRRGLAASNPCENVLRLKNDRRNLEILTAGEVLKMFPADYSAVWGDKEIVYAANRLASLTGMRIGELLGLRGEYVLDDYILVCGQCGKFGYKKSTKTKLNRKIPLMPEMIGLLRKLAEKNGSGFVFSKDGGVTAVVRDYIVRGFSAALEKTGIGRAEAKRRGLTFHGWRHFLNTELLQYGLTLEQVQGVTGHISKKSSAVYTHIDPRQITDVIKAQEVISGKTKKEPPKADNAAPVLKIVKMPETGNCQERKPA